MPSASVHRLLAVAAVLLPVAAVAGTPAAPQHPYAGQEARPIKALSAQEIADLRAGRGMGLALAAELNGYPGPVHVLEHADALGLDDAQRARTRDLHAAMKVEAVRLGERLIAEEAALDRLFASGSIDAAGLEAAIAAISRTRGALRAAHLRYHLDMAGLLTPAQVQRYAELRGYAGRAGSEGSRGTGRGGHAH